MTHDQDVLAGTVPARSALATAHETNERLGHENLGFLSESHGFMPRTAPLLQLPATHRAWDEVAERLPALYRSLYLRRAVNAMPLLNADESDLPDRFLLRASVVLTMVAHAYYDVESRPHAGLPDCIRQPWDTVARRLGKPTSSMSVIDMVAYNWRFVDPTSDDPMRVENLLPLCATVGSREQNVSWMTLVEVLAQSAPIVGAVVCAQEAVWRDDAHALKCELLRITDCLRHVTFVSLAKTNPHPYSDVYVDPVVWSKTVVTVATPIQAGVDQGPAGTGMPLFHLLDTFFGRADYSTTLGHEVLKIRKGFPPHWRAFLTAVEQVSVPAYVARRGDRALTGVFHEAGLAYAGENGLLGRHRLKAYGYIDLSFKVGRNATVAGFSGQLRDRVWDQTDAELERARVERNQRVPRFAHHARVKRVEIAHAEGTHWVKQVVFDVAGTGIRYQPGDRCAVLPENSADLVEKTLQALRARGDEPIALNVTWRKAVALRDGFETATSLSLRTLLRFGRIRPVDRTVAKALHATTHNKTLWHIIEARTEDQWELWDLIALLARGGFNPKRLWKARAGDREGICWIVPPELFRVYSISSVMEDRHSEGARELHLTIGQLSYRTRESTGSPARDRRGTASHFLGGAGADPAALGPVALQIIHPPQFSLPRDPRAPVVMFAGGTGLAPFRGFILERTAQDGGGANWLFFGTRTRADLYYGNELARAVAQGRLHVHVAFSRDDVAVTFMPDDPDGSVRFVAGERHHIEDEILREEHVGLLWDLLRSKKEGGQGAYVYVCGRTGFAHAVMAAIKEVLRRGQPAPAHGGEVAREMLYRLVGEGRYMQEIFTTYAASPHDGGQVYPTSTVVLHNNERDGLWMIIDGDVYDMTEFAHLHPGGFRIIQGYAGMDATAAYEKVLHHLNPEVHAMLGMYRIGAVRRLDFGAAWGVAISPKGLCLVSLENAYQAWIRFLYLAMEIENALSNDVSVQHATVTRGEAPADRSPLKLKLAIETHQRFIAQYLNELVGEALEVLWAIISGLCGEHETVRWMRRTVAEIRRTAEAQAVEDASGRALTQLDALVARQALPVDAEMRALIAAFDMLEAEDRRFLYDLRRTLRAGLQVFEAFERDTLARGGHQLLAAIKEIPTLLKAYYSRTYPGLRAIHRFPGDGADAPPSATS